MGNIRAGNTSRRVLGGIVAAGLALSAGVVGMSAAAAGSKPGITARLGASRPLPQGFFGINYDYGGASVYVKDHSLAMTWLDEAAHGARTGTQITFPGGPALGAGGDPALVGDSFSGTGTRGEMLINLSGSPVTITAGTAVPAGARYRQATGRPTSQIATAAQLTMTSGTIGRSLALAPYSMIVIS